MLKSHAGVEFLCHSFLNRTCSAIAIFGLALTGCSEPPVPETYGVYVRNGSELFQLQANSASQVEGDSEFIVFDKILGSGLFGSGGVDLEKAFSIHPSAFVRYQVERVRERRSAVVTEVHISPADGWLTLDDVVEVAFGPIDGQSEMLLIRPSVKLPDGVYALRTDSKSYRFSVGFAPSDASESPLNRCKDRHSDARPKSAGFSWGDWMNAVQGTSQSAHGNWLESTGYLDCSVLDTEAKGWREAATNALESGDLEKAVGPARFFAAYDPESGQELIGALYGGLNDRAQAALQAEAWGDAIEAATLGLALKPGDQDLMRVSSQATQKKREIEQAARAAAEARRAARVKESYTVTKTLGRFTVISNKVSRQYGLVENARHPIEITDVSIKGLAYLRNAGWITSTNKLEDEFWFCWVAEGAIGPGRTYNGHPYVTLTFRNRWDWAAVFETEAERAHFIEVFNAAVGSWYQRYGDLLVSGKCPTT